MVHGNTKQDPGSRKYFKERFFRKSRFLPSAKVVVGTGHNFLIVIMVSCIKSQPIESVAWQWSHMKDKLMQTKEQSEKNYAGAPSGPFRGLKGIQKSKNSQYLESLVFSLISVTQFSIN